MAEKKNDDYRQRRFYAGRTDASKDGFQAFENDEMFYFTFNADSDIVLLSQGYSSAAGRDNGVESVKKNRKRKGAIVASKRATGRFIFVVKSGNGQEVARSVDYPSIEVAELAGEIFAGRKKAALPETASMMSGLAKSKPAKKPAAKAAAKPKAGSKKTPVKKTATKKVAAKKTAAKTTAAKKAPAKTADKTVAPAKKAEIDKVVKAAPVSSAAPTAQPAQTTSSANGPIGAIGKAAGAAAATAAAAATVTAAAATKPQSGKTPAFDDDRDTLAHSPAYNDGQGSGLGLLLGVLLAIVIIAVLVYFFVLKK